MISLLREITWREVLEGIGLLIVGAFLVILFLALGCDDGDRIFTDPPVVERCDRDEHDDCVWTGNRTVCRDDERSDLPRERGRPRRGDEDEDDEG